MVCHRRGPPVTFCVWFLSRLRANVGLMKSDAVPYSYRDDPDVPEFTAPVCFTVMDAQCAICARGARWIARNDGAGEFRIIPLQSPTGSALMRHYGLDPLDPSSWLFVEEGRAYASMDAIIRVGKRLGGRWRALGLLRVLPRRVQDTLYYTFARYRYRLAGRADLCGLPDPEVQKRLLQ